METKTTTKTWNGLRCGFCFAVKVRSEQTEFGRICSDCKKEFEDELARAAESEVS